MSSEKLAEICKSVVVEQNADDTDEKWCEEGVWMDGEASKEDIDDFKRSINVRPKSSLKFRNKESRACLVQ